MTPEYLSQLIAHSILEKDQPIPVLHLRCDNGTVLDIKKLTLLINGLPKEPLPQIMSCPACRKRHIDEGEWETRPHHTHACQHCGFVWRPAVEPTVGVRFLPDFKNED